MKAAKIIANILVTLAAIAGAVYVLATYGEQIAAWCRKLLDRIPCFCQNDVEVSVIAMDAEEEAPAEEAPVEEDFAN